jgi:hypothetical protein
MTGGGIRTTCGDADKPEAAETMLGAIWVTRLWGVPVTWEADAMGGKRCTVADGNDTTTC